MTSTAVHGYSGKPLSQKLGLKPDMTCLTIRPPDHLHDLLGHIERVRFIQRAAPSEMVLAFARRRRELSPLFSRSRNSVTPGGAIWMAWPKKSSPLFVDITEQDLRDLILPQGWVDVKVCAIDQDWSGLKFLKRKS